MNRRLVVLALALTACGREPEQAKPRPDPTAEQAPVEAEPPPAEPVEPDYSSFGMPGADEAWSTTSFSAARKAINAIAKQDKQLLPRDGSPTFARMAEVDHLRVLAARLEAEQLAGLSLSLGAIHMVYGDQIRRDPTFEREALMLTAALIAVTTRLPVTTVRTVAEAEALRSEPSRLQNLLRYRHGVFEMVSGMLEPAANSVLPRGVACEQLVRVIDDAAPLLLEEERASLRTRVQACEGAEPGVVETLERALEAEAPSAALVTALLAEHREFSSRSGDRAESAAAK